jgi:hypothetical protein
MARTGEAVPPHPRFNGACKLRPERGERAMEQKQEQMVRISVEVRSGTARFRVGVQAQSIRRALSLVAGRYPHGVVEVAFPIEPDEFFVSERTYEEAA